MAPGRSVVAVLADPPGDGPGAEVLVGGDGEVPDVGARGKGEFVLGFEAGQQVAQPAGMVVELPAVRAVARGQVCCLLGVAVRAAGGAVNGRAGQSDVEQVVAGVGHQRVGQPVPHRVGQSRNAGWRLDRPAGSGAAAGIRRAGTMIVFVPAWMPSAQPGRTCTDIRGRTCTDIEASGRGLWRMADGAQHDAGPRAHRVSHAAACRRAVVLASAGLPGGSRLGSASGRRVRDGTVMVRGSWWQRPAGGW